MGDTQKVFLDATVVECDRMHELKIYLIFDFEQEM